ncbi:hypothetical protein N665_0330s0056 [Sinapis alba]|nr:hypothetical protein N665_0330s0056 [Sinapis alba]
MEESKIIFQEDKLLSGQVKLKEDEYLPKECFITNLRIETKEFIDEIFPKIWNMSTCNITHMIKI